MTRSMVYSETTDSVTGRATSYTSRDGELTDVDYTPLNFIYGDGNIQSSIEELFQWDQALYGERLVSASMLAQAFAPAVLDDGAALEDGLGWNVNRA